MPTFKVGDLIRIKRCRVGEFVGATGKVLEVNDNMLKWFPLTSDPRKDPRGEVFEMPAWNTDVSYIELAGPREPYTTNVLGDFPKRGGV